jgi:hypothetical protein
MVQFPQEIVRQLIIYGGDGLPDVQIGPGPDIKFFQGVDLIIELTADFVGVPAIFIQNPAGSQLQLSLFGGVPGINFTIAGNSGSAGMSFIEWGANIDSLQIGMGGEGGDTTRMSLREDALGFGEIVVNQEIVAEDPASALTSETWHALPYNLALGTPWSNFGGGYANAQYRLMPDGTVMLRGAVTCGNPKVDGTVWATLPSGYRPPFTSDHMVASGALGARISIATTGAIACVSMGALAAFTLDGIRFELGII